MDGLYAFGLWRHPVPERLREREPLGAQPGEIRLHLAGTGLGQPGPPATCTKPFETWPSSVNLRPPALGIATFTSRLLSIRLADVNQWLGLYGFSPADLGRDMHGP